MKVFFNALIIHLVFNVYVFARGWKVLPDKKAWKIPYATLFIVELVLYLIGFAVNTSLPHAILKPILIIGTSWMILIGYISALLLIYDALKFASKWIKPLSQLHLHKPRVKRYYFIASCLLVFMVMAYGNYNFRNPAITEYNLSINKKVDGMDSLRVVMVSDIHLGYFIDKDILKKYIHQINALKPDVVLIVGDVIDYDLEPLLEEKMHEEFLQLKAPYGVFVSTGNHEYRLNAEEKIAWLANKTGMTLLRDSLAKIADKIYIVGREDDKCPTRKSLDWIIKDVDHALPILVMKHQPKRMEEESNNKVDLALYGHTHNGQLFPYNLIVGFFYEVGYGYKKKDNTQFYVSSGLGLAGPQYRIGTNSEIAVFNLKFN